MTERHTDAGVETERGPDDALERVRTVPRAHAAAVVTAVGLGLVATWIHWLGLVVGGTLVGLLSPTLPRAIGGALAFGLLVLVAFALSLGSSTGAVLEMTPAVYVTVAAALGLPVVGALSRAIV
ncbi:hypothetical protein ACFOZ7_04210 [Natribaculum luteum]|uniref:Uncharacterized protein n=1 Tax=Natribaculum luteum TaxID=1586232 RepID=A0ABD5NVR0_9EURY|nr:hypothetical protein [Natribaculum luteum]